MAGNEDIFRRVREAVDIVDVIAEHIVLKKAGREFKCICPFHDDHRPSMAIVPHKQIFHCFVCGTGGDVFKFVMNYHKMTWGEALRFLAQRAGIVLPELPPRGGGGGGARPVGSGGSSQVEGDKSERELITDTNERACTFFQKYLRGSDGKPGLDYLEKRGLTDEIMTQFRLGFSPEGWTGLVTAAGRVGMRSDHLALAGLAKQRGDGSQYDAFRGRVMFPIFDATGRIIAFGGRILVEKRDEAGNVVEAKYLNSPESRAFNKSESLYGINFAKRAIIASQTVVVVEGYMDVIACHQAGVTNVVATLGTALTPEHAKVLRRFCNTVVLIFDSDEAGYRAADRAMETFVREPLDVKIASVPDGKDPCDFCMAHGGEEFKKVIAGAVDALTYQWSRMQRDFAATDSLAGKQAAAQQFMRFVAPLIHAGGGAVGTRNDPIRRALILSRISEMLNMPVGLVSQTLEKMAQQAGIGRPVVAAPASQNAEGGGEVEGEDKPTMTVIPDNARTAAEAWVLGTLLTVPLFYDKLRARMDLAAFEAYKPLASRVLEYLDNSSELTHCNLADFCAWLEGTEDQALVGQAIQLQGKVDARGLKIGELDKDLMGIIPKGVLEGGEVPVALLEQILQKEWKFLEENHLQAPPEAEDQESAMQQAWARAQQQRKDGKVGRVIGPKSMF
ncbi:MAG: DNA primase [Phycisphaerae bacterium]